MTVAGQPNPQLTISEDYAGSTFIFLSVAILAMKVNASNQLSYIPLIIIGAFLAIFAIMMQFARKGRLGKLYHFVETFSVKKITWVLRFVGFGLNLVLFGQLWPGLAFVFVGVFILVISLTGDFYTLISSLLAKVRGKTAKESAS